MYMYMYTQYTDYYAHQFWFTEVSEVFPWQNVNNKTCAKPMIIQDSPNLLYLFHQK